MTRRAIEILLVIALAVPCFAGDREFKSVVQAIEMDYGVKQMHIPFLGFATFCLHAAGTPGTSGFKLAVFQHLKRPAGSTTAQFERGVAGALGSDWRPIVRVRSHGEKQFTVIYADTAGKDMKMMIVALDPDQATIVQVKLRESDVKKLMNDPEDMGN